MTAFADVDDVVRRFDAHDYLLDIGTASAFYLAVTLGRPLLLEGEPGVGKTTAAKTLADCSGRSAGPAAVLRRADRQRGPIRLELPTTVAQHPAGRGPSRHDRRIRLVHRELSRRPPDPAVRAPPRSDPAGVADRRNRPSRRRIRGAAAGVPRRSAVTVPELGYVRRRAPADRRPDLQPQPRSARRAAAALPVPLDRIPRARPGGRDRPAHGAGRDRRRSSSRPPNSSAQQGIWTSTSRPAWPRRSTGSPRWSRSASRTWLRCRRRPTHRRAGQDTRRRRDAP